MRFRFVKWFDLRFALFSSVSRFALLLPIEFGSYPRFQIPLLVKLFLSHQGLFLGDRKLLENDKTKEKAKDVTRIASTYFSPFAFIRRLSEFIPFT